MYGHYHIHLRVRELAVAPSAVNHVALRDHFFLGVIFREPHKAETFRAAGPAFPLYLKQEQIIRYQNRILPRTSTNRRRT